MKQTLALFVQSRLHWDAGIWKALGKEEWMKQIYTLSWKMDKNFCLARKLKCFYKAQWPPLNANSMSLLAETQHSCFVSSLFSCLHAPSSSWISLCRKGQWSRFHLPLQVRPKLLIGAVLQPHFSPCAQYRDQQCHRMFTQVRQPGVLQREMKEE